MDNQKSTLDEILECYEVTHKGQTDEIPRKMTDEESQLLSDYLLNGIQTAIYEYYDLKNRLDKEWIDREMNHKLNPW
jgi:hypothetical protein